MRGLVSIVLCAALLALSACSGHAPGATTVTSTQSNNYEPSAAPLDASKADVTAIPTSNEAPESTTDQSALPAAEPTNTTDQTGVEDMLIYAYTSAGKLTIHPADNTSAEAFIELLKHGDITVSMHDYGGFEKVGALGAELPTNDERITTQPGDVILYQGDQITIYYAQNTWRFTRLGKVLGMTQAELLEALGDGDVDVRFSLDNAN